MRRKLAVPAMAVAMVLLAVVSSLAAKVLLEDRFTTLEPSWGEAGANLSAKDGKLLIATDKGMAQTFLNQATLPNDLEASFTLAYVKAPGSTYGSGLVFWAKDYGDWYALLINAKGWFAVQRQADGRFLLLVDWRESDALKKGEGAENQVKVATKGNQATVSINGKEVVSFTGQPPEGGSLIGFRVSSGPEGSNSAAFSNFQVVQPQRLQPIPSPAPADSPIN